MALAMVVMMMVTTGSLPEHRVNLVLQVLGLQVPIEPRQAWILLLSAKTN